MSTPFLKAFLRALSKEKTDPKRSKPAGVQGCNGNLDSESEAEVLKAIFELYREGKTISSQLTTAISQKRPRGLLREGAVRR